MHNLNKLYTTYFFGVLLNAMVHIGTKGSKAFKINGLNSNSNSGGNEVVSKKIFKMGAIVAAAALFVGCADNGDPGTGNENGNSEESFTIYMNTPLTGSLSNVARANVATLEVVVEAINAEGGILGRQVEIIVADDQLDTTRAVTLLQEQIDKEVPDLVLMGATSNTGLAMLPLLSRNKIISAAVMQSSAINDPGQYPYVFVPYVESKADAEGLVAELTARGAKKIALLTANDANGQSTSGGMIPVFEAEGFEVFHEEYAPDATDMTPQLLRLQSQSPDALVIQAFGAATSHILTGRTKLGWDVPTLGHSSIGLGQDLSDISSEADWDNIFLGVFPVTAGNAPGDSQILSNLIAEVKAKGDPVGQSLHYYSVYWDLLWLLKKGFDQAGSLDADEVKSALENLQPNAEIDSKLLTFPVEYMRWSPESHFFEIPGSVVMDYVKPGPLVDGVIQSID